MLPLLLLALAAHFAKEWLDKQPKAVQHSNEENSAEGGTEKRNAERGRGLAVMILSGDGDKLKQSLIDRGEEGGRLASAELHAMRRKELGDDAEKTETIVFLVAHSGQKAALGRSRFDDAFLRGFATSKELSVVVAPQNGPEAFGERVKQLVATYLPLTSVTHLFVGSLHSRRVVRSLDKIPSELQKKVVLLLTGEAKPLAFNLVAEGRFKAIHLPSSLYADSKEPGDKEEVKKEEEGETEEQESSPEPLFDFPRTPKRKPASALLGRSALPLPSTTPSLSPFKVPKANFPVRPCNDYYLSPLGCTRSECPYAHDTQITAEEWDAFPSLIKSFICPKMRDQGHCSFGEECYMGHRCPFTPTACPYGIRCHFLKAGLPHSART